MAIYRVLLSFLLLGILICIFLFPVNGNLIGSTCLTPEPPVYVAEVQGEDFNIDVMISEVQGLYSCEFSLVYNSSILNLIAAFNGGFFPQTASFSFNVEETNSHSFVEIKMSLVGSQASLSGSGRLARIVFRTIGTPASGFGSILLLNQINLAGPDSEPLGFQSVSAVFFWQSLFPRTPLNNRSIDLYTQKGGIGAGEYGGRFSPGQKVQLTAYVTYDGWPQQSLLVAFQAIDPLNQTQFVLIDETNEEGKATVEFRIPNTHESAGNWTLVSSVDVACQTVWDTTVIIVTTPIGGEASLIAEGKLQMSFAVYIAIIATLVISYTILKQSITNLHKKSENHSSSPAGNSNS